MKNNILTLFLVLLIAVSCDDQEFLSKDPKNILLEDQVWSDGQLAFSVLADLYNRYPTHQQLESWWLFADFDEAIGSFGPDFWRVRNIDYGYDFLRWWDYGYVREINLFIRKAELSDLDQEVKSRLLAEGRFVRAAIYFDLVKRMGGVPLILEPLTYNFDGNVEALQYPRSEEHEIYDFIIEEMEAIKGDLPNDPALKTRATTGLALALESRAALYAGSIAKYGGAVPEVSLAGGEIGIPSEMAEDYYEISLRAAEEITGYSLYQKTPNLGENFANLFLDKDANPEVIFAKDYLDPSRTHGFTFEAIPLSLREDNDAGGKLNPSLNLVEAFEKLDNTFEPLQTGLDTYYENPEDLFADRDARLWGTVIYPGATFRGSEIDIFRGLKLEDGSLKTSGNPGETEEVISGQGKVQIVGRDGPVPGKEFTTQTGFIIRKYLDTQSGSGQRGTGSAVWWIRYRYAEVLLNAAEAAYELNQTDKALQYLNQVRSRAGFETPLTAGDLSLSRFVHERQVEFAFEDHRVWDLKRWRLAHVIWNGENMTIADLDDNLDDATTKNTQMFGVMPYKVYNPGGEHDGEWVFEKVKPQVVEAPERWRLGNYYSSIAADVLANNPKLVRNPNH